MHFSSKVFFNIVCACTALFLLVQGAYAQQSGFYRGLVISVVEDRPMMIEGAAKPYQRLEVQVQTGLDAGKKMILDYGGEANIDESQKLHAGDKVIVQEAQLEDGTKSYIIYDSYRLNPIIGISIFFLIVAAFFGRIRGFSSVLGMIFSLLVLSSGVVPFILKGGNPLLASIVGAAVIAVISLYLAHGFNKRTSIALLSTLLTLGLSTFISSVFVSLAKLSGTAQEEAAYLHFDALPNLDVRGLLLGGIIIGVLGILDDITTAQVAVVYELKNANHNLSFKELYRRGLSVGREHIASLINTLVLAYAGASFPLFLLFAFDTSIPVWVTLNDEFVAEEIIRTLAGSVSLVFAVPIATFFAAYFLSKSK